MRARARHAARRRRRSTGVGVCVHACACVRARGRWRRQNGADAGNVIELYNKTSTSLLGTVPSLEFKELAWTAEDYVQLGAALGYCFALTELTLDQMGVGDAGLAAVLGGLASPATLRSLKLWRCEELTALPDLSALRGLTTLNLSLCTELKRLPDLSALGELTTLDLTWCKKLERLPDVSALTSLKTFYAPDHLMDQLPRRFGGSAP